MLRCLVLRHPQHTGIHPTLQPTLLPSLSVLEVASHLEIGTLVATMPRAWHFRVSARTGWPVVSILRLPSWPSGYALKHLPRERQTQGFDSQAHLHQEFSWSSHTSDLHMATLPGAWYYRVNPWTAWPGVSIL